MSFIISAIQKIVQLINKIKIIIKFPNKQPYYLLVLFP